MVAACTCRGSFGKDFAAVHRRWPGVVVEFRAQEFQRRVVSVDHPDADVADVTSAAGLD